MPVELTEKQKKSPLYKYYELPIKPVPEERVREIMAMEFEDGREGIPIEDINQMLDEGYKPGEFGLLMTPTGARSVANLLDMPGVTPEMFDWWFAWHGLDPMRYTIWDKDDHYYAQTQNVEQGLDSSLSYAERYWNTSHKIRESMRDGAPPVSATLTFVPPWYVGFDMERMKAIGATAVVTPGPVIMVHFVRPTPTGSELRTRLWFGYKATPNGIERIPDFQGRPGGGPFNPGMMAKGLLLHNIKEFTHLAEILPSLFNEYKDDFTVGFEFREDTLPE